MFTSGRVFSIFVIWTIVNVVSFLIVGYDADDNEGGRPENAESSSEQGKLQTTDQLFIENWTVFINTTSTRELLFSDVFYSLFVIRKFLLNIRSFVRNLDRILVGGLL